MACNTPCLSASLLQKVSQPSCHAPFAARNDSRAPDGCTPRSSPATPVKSEMLLYCFLTCALATHIFSSKYFTACVGLRGWEHVVYGVHDSTSHARCPSLRKASPKQQKTKHDKYDQMYEVPSQKTRPDKNSAPGTDKNLFSFEPPCFW